MSRLDDTGAGGGEEEGTGRTEEIDAAGTDAATVADGTLPCRLTARLLVFLCAAAALGDGAAFTAPVAAAAALGRSRLTDGRRCGGGSAAEVGGGGSGANAVD